MQPKFSEGNSYFMTTKDTVNPSPYEKHHMPLENSLDFNEQSSSAKKEKFTQDPKAKTFILGNRKT